MPRRGNGTAELIPQRRPTIGTESLHHVAVYLGPKRFRLLPLPLSRGGEPHSADPLVLLVSCLDSHQTIPLHGPEIPGERRPIHSHQVREHREGLRAEAMEHGEDGELTGEEPRRSERSLIGLGHRPGGSAQVEADAGGGGGELGGHDSQTNRAVGTDGADNMHEMTIRCIYT